MGNVFHHKQRGRSCSQTVHPVRMVSVLVLVLVTVDRARKVLLGGSEHAPQKPPSIVGEDVRSTHGAIQVQRGYCTFGWGRGQVARSCPRKWGNYLLCFQKGPIEQDQPASKRKEKKTGKNELAAKMQRRRDSSCRSFLFSACHAYCLLRISQTTNLWALPRPWLALEALGRPEK